MPSLFPSQIDLYDSFAPHHPITYSKRALRPKWQEPATPILSEFPAVAFSISEDSEEKARSMGEHAANEVKKATSAVQAKTGTIELYSLKYYEACTFGGLIACVRLWVPVNGYSVTKTISRD